MQKINQQDLDLRRARVVGAFEGAAIYPQEFERGHVYHHQAINGFLFDYIYYLYASATKTAADTWQFDAIDKNTDLTTAEIISETEKDNRLSFGANDYTNLNTAPVGAVVYIFHENMLESYTALQEIVKGLSADLSAEVARKIKLSDLVTTGTAGETKYLRGDGLWASITAAHITGAANANLNIGASMATMAGETKAIDTHITDLDNRQKTHKHPVSDIVATGTAGTTTYLRGDGSWVIPPNTTYSLMTQSEYETATATAARLISASHLKDAIVYHTSDKVDTNDTRLSDTRVPKPHIHPISDITGLQAAIDGKANKNHTHPISDVTGLQDELDSKATPANVAASAAQLKDEILGGAGGAFDTLKELQDALGGDANFATTVSSRLDAKANANHTHIIPDIAGLESALDTRGIQEIDYTDTGRPYIKHQIQSGTVIRRDDSVGTRVFIGDVMVHGDTGVRDVKSLVNSNSFSLSGSLPRLTLSRRNSIVTLSFRIRIESSASETNILSAIPAGFRLNSQSKFVSHGIGLIGDQIVPVGAYNDGSQVKVTADLTSVGLKMLSGMIQWVTDDAWPTSLPGTPA